MAFQLAYFEDARALGITPDKYGGKTNENYFSTESEKLVRVSHDNALAEIIFYEYMLDHPRIYERYVKEINEQQKMLAEAGASYAFEPRDEIAKILKEINIPNKKSETLRNVYGTEWLTGDGSVHSTLNQFIYDSEVPMRYARPQIGDRFGRQSHAAYNLPSRNEMRDYIKAAGKVITDTLVMNEIFKSRKNLFKEVKKEMKALGDGVIELHGYMDIIDAMSGGDARTNHGLIGHGESYFNDDRAEPSYGVGELKRRRLSETFAQLGAAWASVDRADWNRMKERLPNLTREFERIMEENKDAIIEPRYTSSSQAVRDLGLKVRSSML